MTFLTCICLDFQYGAVKMDRPLLKTGVSRTAPTKWAIVYFLNGGRRIWSKNKDPNGRETWYLLRDCKNGDKRCPSTAYPKPEVEIWRKPHNELCLSVGWGGSASNTMSPGLPPYQVVSWSIQSSSHNKHKRKSGGDCCAPFRGDSWVPI